MVFKKQKAAGLEAVVSGRGSGVGQRFWNGKRALIFAVAFAIVGGAAVWSSFALTGSGLAIDVQASKHDTSESTKITLGNFSTNSSKEVLVAFIDSDGPQGGKQYFKGVAGGGLQWRLIVRSNGQYGTAEVWEAVAANPLHSVTFTATRAVDGYNGEMTVVGFTGADTGAVGASAQSNAGSGAPTISLTTTRAGSWVWATGNDWDSATRRTVGSGQVIADQFVDKYSNDTYWAQYQKSLVAQGGTNVTLNDTLPIGDRWNMAAVEILPAASSTVGVPSAPSNLTGTLSGGGTVNQKVALTWSASTEANGSIVNYVVYRNGTKLGTATTTSYADTTTGPSASYSYYVVATDAKGTTSQQSNIFSVTTPAPQTCPAGQTGTPPNCVASPSGGTLWSPTAAAPVSWYWQLNGTVNTSHKAQMYDIDGFDNPATTVSTLHAQGVAAVVCYIDVGTWENWRSDASSFPSSVLGSSNGWPGEKWLDIRQLSALEPIMTARMQMCKTKGFDAIEPDNIDGYTNKTGFPLTAQDQLTYNEWIANEAHNLGLSVGLKNDVDQTAQLQPYFNWALDEQCNQYSECNTMVPFTQANKAVFNAEYSGGTGFCTADAAARINGALFSLNLDGTTFTPCTQTW